MSVLKRIIMTHFEFEVHCFDSLKGNLGIVDRATKSNAKLWKKSNRLPFETHAVVSIWGLPFEVSHLFSDAATSAIIVGKESSSSPSHAFEFINVFFHIRSPNLASTVNYWASQSNLWFDMIGLSNLSNESLWKLLLHGNERLPNASNTENSNAALK